MPLANKQVVLASGSSARRKMLEDAGLMIVVDPADVDEAIIRKALLADDDAIDPSDLAEVLARAKADRVSQRQTGEVVIAGDQVLSCDGQIYSKPKTVADAQTQLLALRGKTHRLHSCAVIAIDQEVTFVTTGVVDVQFRDFSAAFVGQYLAAAGDMATTSVGAYQLEGLGSQLIEKLDGDYFTVLGLPLLDVLAELRRMSVLAE